MKTSKTGYKRNSKDKNEPILKIPSNHITMKEVDFPVLGISKAHGNTHMQMMYPGMDYLFPGNYVYEIPMAQRGGDPSIPDLSNRGWLSKYQKGGKRAPIYVTDKNDPRFIAYNDSLNSVLESSNLIREAKKRITENYEEGYDAPKDYLGYYVGNHRIPNYREIKPIKTYYRIGQDLGLEIPIYKKPTQPVIYKPEPEIKPISSRSITLPTASNKELMPSKKLQMQKGIVPVREVYYAHFNPSHPDAGKILHYYDPVKKQIVKNPEYELKRDGGWLQKYQDAGQIPSKYDLMKIDQPETVAESTKVVVPHIVNAPKQVATVKQEAKRVKEVMKATGAKSPAEVYAQEKEKAKLDQIAANQQSTLSPAPERGVSDYLSYAWDVASNPMTAARYKMMGQEIPWNFTKSGDRNVLDMPLDIINPAFYTNTAGRLMKASTDLNTYTDVGNTVWAGLKGLSGDAITPEEMKSVGNTAGLAGDMLTVLPGVAAASKYARPLAEFATTRTPLQYAYKINPWAFKPNPEAYYHRSPNLENIVNQETGMLQGFGNSDAGKAYSELAIPKGGINLRKAANSQLYFSKGVPLDYGRTNMIIDKNTGKLIPGQGYKGPYMIEVEGVPMGASTKGSRPGAEPTRIGSYAVSKRPISLDEAKFYQEDWLWRYKQIETPKQLPGSANTPLLKRSVIYPEPSKPLPDYMEPYLGKVKQPISRSEEIFRTFLTPETQAKLEASDWIYYDREGNIISNKKLGGWLSKYQVGGSNFKTKLTPEEELKFQAFYKTLPDNLRTDDLTYDIRGYWDASDRPKEFDYSQPKEEDGYYHAFSRHPITGKILKSPTHPTFSMAVSEKEFPPYVGTYVPMLRPDGNVYMPNVEEEYKKGGSTTKNQYINNVPLKPSSWLNKYQ